MCLKKSYKATLCAFTGQMTKKGDSTIIIPWKYCIAIDVFCRLQIYQPLAKIAEITQASVSLHTSTYTIQILKN